MFCNRCPIEKLVIFSSKNTTSNIEDIIPFYLIITVHMFYSFQFITLKQLYSTVTLALFYFLCFYFGHAEEKKTTKGFKKV